MGFNLNNRGCKPTENEYNLPATLKGLNIKDEKSIAFTNQPNADEYRIPPLANQYSGHFVLFAVVRLFADGTCKQDKSPEILECFAFDSLSGNWYNRVADGNQNQL